MIVHLTTLKFSLPAIEEPIRAEYHSVAIFLPNLGAEDDLEAPAGPNFVTNMMTTSKKFAETAEKHVLVVDDDPEIIESIKYALSTRGFKVSIARDGNQGVAFAETKHPDLLILDMMMPKRSGFLVLERLRQNNEKPVPVIMITGNEGQRHQEYAELLGVSDYIHKPFTMDRLLESVDGLLSKTQ